MLVNKPFTNWIKVHKIVQGHESNSYHYHAVQEGLDFQSSIEQPETNIDVRMSTELFQRIQENRNVVLSVYFTVGDNVLPLEEMLKRSVCLVTLVTFLAILKLLATHAPVLKAHLETEILPPHIQNDKRMIQKSIVEEVIQAHFYSIMVDEVTSHNQELMPLCVRFVDVHKNIRE